MASDADEVEKLYYHLTSEGVDVWRDKRCLPSGHGSRALPMACAAQTWACAAQMSLCPFEIVVNEIVKVSRHLREIVLEIALALTYSCFEFVVLNACSTEYMCRLLLGQRN